MSWVALLAELTMVLNKVSNITYVELVIFQILAITQKVKVISLNKLRKLSFYF